MPEFDQEARNRDLERYAKIENATREQQIAAWLEGRSRVILDLAARFPPAARIRAIPGKVLVCPAPGVIGQVASYFENGTLGVVAEGVIGWTRGQCRPEWLELVN